MDGLLNLIQLTDFTRCIIYKNDHTESTHKHKLFKTRIWPFMYSFLVLPSMDFLIVLQATMAISASINDS